MTEQTRQSGAEQKKTEMEMHMGGPVGALVLTLLMPSLSIYLWICIFHNDGAFVLPTSADAIKQLIGHIPLPTGRAVLYFSFWLLLQIVLQLFAPGKTVSGIKLYDGMQLRYRVNGWFSFWCSLAVIAGLMASGILPPRAIYEESGGLISTATIFALLLGLFLYVYGLNSPRKERRSGNFIYDFFMGTSLNPRIGSFDLKFFFESRIGMGSWGVLNFAMAAAQYSKYGTLSTPMILVCLFQYLYIADFFFFESALLTTWDIMYENYGFMLVHAFLVWMPFNFSLQAQYLINHPHDLPAWAIVALAVLNLGGYYIFRSANLQKHHFRTDPSTRIWGKPAEYIKTQRGTTLLTSGWWGLARHANYLGDLMMALAWCLPCGFSHVLPFFYFIYFAPLLINRERRDHHVCQAKYGADWDEYCRRVPARILPGVY